MTPLAYQEDWTMLDAIYEANYRPRLPWWLFCTLAVTVCAVICLLSSTGCGPSPEVPQPPPQPEPPSTSIVKLLPLTATTDVNAVRRQAGGHSEDLVWDERLAAVARTQALYMRHLDQLTHGRPLNTTMYKQLMDAGYRPAAWGENVAYTMEPDATAWWDALRLWQQSPGHYANLVNPRFQHMGVAAVRSKDGKRIYFCMVLAARAYEQVDLPVPVQAAPDVE